MKIFLTCLVASLALSASSLAQTSTGTTTKGTMTVYVDAPTGSTDASKTSPTKSTIISEITIMATSTGQIQYGINPNGISYSDPTITQTVSTHEIYDAIAAQAVTDGVTKGYHPVTSSTGTTTKVYDASSTVHEFSIKYDPSTYTPVVTETKETVVTTTSTVQ